MSKADPGFFTMKDAAEVLRKQDLSTAKSYLHDRIKDFVDAHPGTKPENLKKADQMIGRADSIKKLSMAVANFVLAHPSEGLKVVK
jgi:hypothetical protein